jgi:hypothetical protein
MQLTQSGFDRASDRVPPAPQPLLSKQLYNGRWKQSVDPMYDELAY